MTSQSRTGIPYLLCRLPLSCCREPRFFTKLDLRNAYHLVQICEGDEWKTAFNTPTGQNVYLVLAFCLTNSSAVFQALVNDVLRDMINMFIFVYLDDILVFSPSLQVHTQHVHQVLQWLLKNQLFVKAEKCQIHSKSVTFRRPAPDTRKALQRLLGFAYFYRRFISPVSYLPRSLYSRSRTAVYCRGGCF